MKSLRKPLFSKKKTYLSVLEKSLLLGLLLSFLLTMTGFSGQCEAIENQVFRFHVLANSDSQEDQALKLKVRDRVLEYSEGLFQNAQTREEAEALAAAHLQELCQAAQDEVYRQGYDLSLIHIFGRLPSGDGPGISDGPFLTEGELMDAAPAIL